MENLTNVYHSELLIQVINLAKRPDRLALIAADLHKAGLEFETQVAVDGQTLDVDSKFMSKAEIGCFKSHVNAMRRQAEIGALYSLILEDDAALGPEVTKEFLAQMTVLMARNNIDILQIGFIEHFYSLSIKRGILEFLIEILKRRGKKDASGTRFVAGEFRAGAHAYIINNRLASGISGAGTVPAILPFDDWLGVIAIGQTHRNIAIARLAKSVVAQASRLSKNSKVDSNIES